MERQYHVVHVSQDGRAWRRMTAAPLAHDRACTLKSKLVRPAEHMLVEVSDACGCAFGRYGVPCDTHAWKAGAGRVFEVFVDGEWQRIRPEQYRIAADGSLGTADVPEGGTPLHGYGPHTHPNQRGWSRGGWRDT